jgi:hypothetical protein
MAYAAGGVVLMIFIAILCVPLFRVTSILLDEADD